MPESVPSGANQFTISRTVFSVLAPRPSRVRFSSVKEVRILPHEEADEAEHSRRSFDTAHSAVQRMLRHKKKLTIRQVILLSLILSFIVSVVLSWMYLSCCLSVGDLSVVGAW